MSDSAAHPLTARPVFGVVLTTIIVACLGYIDYITGEVSIDVVYIFVICLVAWYFGKFTGLACVVEISAAKILADYFDKVKIGNHLYEWNAVSNLLIYLVVCILVIKLKKTLLK